MFNFLKKRLYVTPENIDVHREIHSLTEENFIKQIIFLLKNNTWKFHTDNYIYTKVGKMKISFYDYGDFSNTKLSIRVNNKFINLLDSTIYPNKDLKEMNDLAVEKLEDLKSKYIDFEIKKKVLKVNKPRVDMMQKVIDAVNKIKTE